MLAFWGGSYFLKQKQYKHRTVLGTIELFLLRFLHFKKLSIFSLLEAIKKSKGNIYRYRLLERERAKKIKLRRLRAITLQEAIKKRPILLSQYRKTE